MSAKITINGVELELDDVFEQITAEQLASEVDERASESCPDILDALNIWADEYGDCGLEGDEDPLFERMSDWDRDDLLKAIREDDGRRAIDVLKRSLSST